MLKRKIEKKIDDWYNTSRHKVLFIDGPRQVGKSYIVDKYVSKKFVRFVEINLAKDTETEEALEGAKNIDDFLLILSARYDLGIDDESTLVFLDEIQLLTETDIVTMIKFLSTNSKRCFAISGSLLGLTLNNYKSWPTGYVFTIDMNCLDFEEFCLAFNVSKNVFDHLRDSFLNKTKVNESINNRMIDLFSLYTIIGGMPEVVERYLETKSIYEANVILSRLNNDYRKDIIAYASAENRPYIQNIYDLIPSELNNRNKRFILKNLDEYTKFAKFDNSFIWLSKAGTTIPVYNCKELSIPFELSKERTLFKLFHNDTGMLISMFSDANLQVSILKKEKSVNFGCIYENVIAKELHCHGFENLYYYNNKKNGEIDFLIELKNEIIPIEVKSGKDYDVHNAALNNVMRLNEEIKRSYVFYNGNIEINGKITYLPIYMIMFIEKEKSNDNVDLDKFEFDFSILQK